MADLIVTLPHASGVLPLEIQAEMLGPAVHDDEARAALLERVRREGDPSSDLLFRLGGARFVSATVSRFVVDLNRSPDDRSANGVVKRTDFSGRDLYPAGAEPDASTIDARLRRYFDPFHAQVERDIARARPWLIVDGHTMTADGPTLGPDAGRPRPAASLITGGGPDGEPTDRPVSLPPDLARRLAAALERSLSARLPLGQDGAPSGVGINEPFAHGYVQERYGADPSGPLVPTVGIEIHRGLFEDADAHPIDERVRRVRAAVAEALDAIRPDLDRTV